jgi:hypothetical protein
MTTGKLRLADGKVVGTIEGLHYSEELWKAMTPEQRAQCLSFCKAKSASRTVKAASTAGSGTIPMDVSGLQSLNSNQEDMPADADQAPPIGNGAQVVPLAPISQERTWDAADADGSDCC